MSEQLTHPRLQAIEHFIEVSSHYTRLQLYFLRFSEPLASQQAQADMDNLVTKAIDENVQALSDAFRGFSHAEAIHVTDPSGDNSALMLGIGYSTETLCYNALVHDGRDKWPLLSGEQLSLSTPGGLVSKKQVS